MLTAGREIPNVKVPDVSGMTVVDAEQVLTDAGFVVKTQTEKVADENYEEEVRRETNKKEKFLKTLLNESLIFLVKILNAFMLICSFLVIF